MLIPSIDLMQGRAVQLIGGRELAIDAGDPFALLDRFALLGEVAVIDLDAARGCGSNAEIIREMVRRARCRVGGGIRSAASALDWLDAGAERVILGTAATPQVLSALPRERVIAALDCEHGEVVVEGWQTRTGAGVLERMESLRGLAGGFLVTFVEREGRMGGTDLERARALVSAAGSGVRVTIAGGVTEAAEIAALDACGADAQVGMAIYDGRLDLADAFAAPSSLLCAGELCPTVVVDERGLALGLAWSKLESLREAIARRRGIYWSRRRGLWVKGESSGAVQELLRVDLDCDRDALRFTVRQAGSGFCHLPARTCWGEAGGLGDLEERLRGRMREAPAGSYTARLRDDPALLRSKLIEEAGELADADGPQRSEEECADLMYFALVRLLAAGGDLASVERILDQRSRRVRRRRGDAKSAEVRTP